MALFTVFCFKDETPSDTFRRLDETAHIEATRTVHRMVKAGGRDYGFHVLANATALYAEDDQDVIRDGAPSLVMNGHAFRYDGGGVVSAKSMADAFSLEGLAGEYAFAHLDGALTAAADPNGIQCLFYVDTPRVFAISTRPAMLAALVGDTTPDLDALAAIAAVGYRIGNRTAYRAVKSVPQGHVLRWDGRLSLTERGRFSARTEGVGLAHRREWFREQVDRAIAAAGAAVRVAANGREVIDLAITGGKDSRLVLALCVAAGLKDRLSLYTTGAEDHPDVVVGRMIAERLGIPHRVTGTQTAAMLPMVTAHDYIDRLRAFAYQADGLAGGWDLFLTPRVGRGLRMSGHVGEVLKAYVKKGWTPDEGLDPATIIRQQSPFDPLGLLRHPERITAEVQAQFDGFLSQGFAPDDLPDLYYYTNRIPNWLGSFEQAWSFYHHTVMPLAVPPLMEMAFAATAAERKMEAVHYEIIRDACPELLDIPFANQQWDEKLSELYPDVPILPPVTLPKGSLTRAFGSWQFAINHNPQIRRDLIQLIERHAGSPIAEVIDLERLKEHLRSRQFAMLEMISLLGVIPELLFAAGDVKEQRLVQGQPRVSPPYHADHTTSRAHVDRVSIDGEDVELSGGHFDVEAGSTVKIYGWAFSKEYPACRMAVEVYAGTRLIARQAADLLRPSLQRDGFGDGRCAFAIAVQVDEPGKLYVTTPEGRVFANGIIRVVTPREAVA